MVVKRQLVILPKVVKRQLLGEYMGSKYPNYITAKRLYSTEFYEGAFDYMKEALSGHLYLEYFQLILPDGSIIFGDEFIERYSELCDKFGIAYSDD